MFIETIHEMESRHMHSYDRGSESEVCKNDSRSAAPGPMTDQDVYWQEDKYVAAEEKASIFKGTFSDSEDECATKFVH